LGDACLRSGDASEAAKWFDEAIALDPFREMGYRRSMEAHSAAGNRAEALRVYERCRRLLREELGAYPSPETESIHRTLLGVASADAAVAPHSRRVAIVQSEPESEARAAVPVRPTRGRRLLVAAGTTLLLATAITVGVFESTGEKSSRGLASVDANSVAVIDPKSGRVVVDVLVGSGPTKVAFGEGAAWVIDADDQTLKRIDPATKTVRQTIAVGDGPTSVAVGSGPQACGAHER
jgi:Bacterial transcriptional activator domain